MTTQPDDSAWDCDPEPIEFSDDMLVLRDVTVPDSTPPNQISRFGDDIWHVHPAALKPTARGTINFSSSPPAFQRALKRVVWCAINFRVPVEMLERPNKARARLEHGTVMALFGSLRRFTRWLDQHEGVTRLCDVDDALLDAYAAEVVTDTIVTRGKHDLLWRITQLWLLAPYLPPQDRIGQPPWEKAGAEARIADLVGSTVRSSENTTPPIHPATMSPLLVWCLRFVEEFGADIIRAKETRDAMNAAIPKHSRSGDQEKLAQYLDGLRRDGGALPGLIWVPGEVKVARRYIAAKLGIGESPLKHGMPEDVPIRPGAPLDIVIEGRIDGRPWTVTIDFYEVDAMVRRLATACLVVIAYLSGMRGEECLALERGCCRPSDPGDKLSRFEIRGKTYKVTGLDGNTIVGGRERSYPWYVIPPVAAAVSVLERLHPHDLLFPVSAFHPRATGGPHDVSVHTTTAKLAIQQLVEWCNTVAGTFDQPESVIPADPEGPVTMRRFRRTLAWFIYRLPFGRISLGIQFGHVMLNVTDGYATRVRSGVGDVFRAEEALLQRDRLEMASERLAAGESVSGLAKDRYVAGVTEYLQFRGKSLTPRQVEALGKNKNLRIYDNDQQNLACCYDASQALCHPDRERVPGIALSPDLTRCDPACANVARTDTHIAAIKEEIRQLEEDRASPLTPKPWRVRLHQRIRRLWRIIADHEREA